MSIKKNQRSQSQEHDRQQGRNTESESQGQVPLPPTDTCTRPRARRLGNIKSTFKNEGRATTDRAVPGGLPRTTPGTI